MNVENIKKAIAVMERAKERDSLNMITWRSINPTLTLLQRSHYSHARSEEEFHACGNTACFAGHLAISPEWIKDGGGCEYNGMPNLAVIEGDYTDRILHGEYAVAHWLGVDILVASNLIHQKGLYGIHPVYKTMWGDVTADHVIKALNELIELGDDGFIAKYNLVKDHPNADFN